MQRVGTDIETAPLPLTTAPTEKVKRPPGRPPGTGEQKRRGRPPASASQRSWQQSGHALPEEDGDAEQECSSSPTHHKDGVEDKDKEKRQTLLGSGHYQGFEAKLHKISRESKVTKLKRLRDVKLSPLKSKLKAIVRKSVPVPGVRRRGRGRPPSAERLKAEAAAAAAQAANESSAQEMFTMAAGTAKHKAFRVRREQDLSARTPHDLKFRASHPADECTSPDPHDSPTVNPMTPTKHGRPLGLRQSPRHIKPVRVVPPSKRTDATIAKQLLQRAKKGAQKKKLLEKEAIDTQGTAGLEGGKHRRRTQLTNIRQFIMPVVSTVSLRIIKTPKRFIEDEGSFSTPPPHMKIARLDFAASAPAPQPITPAPALVSTAPVTSGTTATPGARPAVDSLPPPPPPVPTGSANNIAASLLNSSCNNSTSNGRLFCLQSIISCS